MIMMTFKNMNLYDRTDKVFGTESAEGIKNLFNSIGLPLPLHNQYTVTNDPGFMVFLNDYGCVIRIMHQSTPPLKHSHILEPIAEKKAGNLHIGIYPGVQSPATSNDLHDLRIKLKEENIDFFDTMIANTGILPIKTAEHPEGFPVIIDMGAVEKLRHSVCEARNIIEKSPQSRLYQPLKNKFTEAWPSQQQTADPEKMKLFWNECKKFQKKGLLKTSWLNKDNRFTNYKNAYHGSKKYAATCKKAQIKKKLSGFSFRLWRN